MRVSQPVPDVGDVPGYCPPTAGGGQHTAGPEARGTGARGQASSSGTLGLRQKIF